MGFFGNYKKLHELSVNNQKMDDEENPTPTYGEDDDTPAEPAASTTGDTPAEPPAEDPEPASAEDDGEDPYAIPADDTPENTPTEPTPAAEEPPAEGGDEPAPAAEDDYNIPDDAEPTSAEGDEDPYAIPADDAPEGGDNPDAGGEATPDDTGADAGTDDGGDPYAIPGEGEDAGAEGGEGAEGTVGGDEGGEGEPGADGEVDASTDAGSAIANDLKSMEDEIFADLTDQQKDIRDNELRQNYISLYDTIDEAEKRINNIVKDEHTGRVLEFITRKMNELKELVHHNLTKVFNTRTYIENQTALAQCVAIMNTICDMLDSIAKEDDHKSEDDD